MPSLSAFAAPFAMILPALGHLVAPSSEAKPASETGPACIAQSAHQSAASSRQETDPINAFRDSQSARQVRIERRVTIRISPRRTAPGSANLANLPARASSPRFEEVAMEPCLPVERIAGVQTGPGNRLILFLDDQRIVSLDLERSCRAREFYSGFYVERREDGQLCANRDRLQSRSGARCEIAHMRQLVEVEER